MTLPSPPTRIRAGFARRVLLALLVMSALPMLLAVGVLHHRGRQLVEDLLGENVRKTARAHAVDLDAFLDETRDHLRALDPSDPEGLAASVAADPRVLVIMSVSQDGALRAATEAADALAPWAVEACGALVARPDQPMTHAGAGHAHEAVIASPTDDGVLCAQVSFTLHQDLLTERTRSLFGGTAYIVDRGGRVICHAFEADEPHVLRGATLHEEAQSVAADGLPWSGRIGPRGEQSFAAFAPARSLPWGVWVEVPTSRAAAPLSDWLRQVLALAAALTVGVAVVAVTLVRRLVAPLRELGQAARGIAEGRYGDTVPEAGDDEVADLAREFNHMSAALAESYAKLDERVAQRTRELKVAQASLVHQEKMAALGTLAAGLAHEIGNPLASLSSELEMLERYPDPEELKASVPVMRDQIRRMSKLLRELVELGKPPSDELREHDPEAMLEDVARLLRHDPRARGREVVVEAPPGLPALCTSRDRVVQILLNFGLNALEALAEGEGGRVVFGASREGEGLRLSVTDDGPGVPEAIASRVFEPFFTTRAEGQGAGLGLFVSQRVADTLGGRLELSEAPGGGARFSLVLPRSGCPKESPHA